MNEAKEKRGLWKTVYPLVVLVIICVVVGALLGFVNSATAPVIEENARIQAEQTRAAVLPGATGFTELDCDLSLLNLTGAYVEDSGLGYVFTSANKGYGGDVTVTVGLNPDGEIVGLNANVSTETSGIGSKAGQSAYTDLFIGLTGDSSSVDTISGASYSSRAVKTGVDAALAAYAALVQ
ncbi:MAG: FMN-binding protein [Oscillospiraceae bacterium]|nr:FMN-binding protein [Oscillospiraceae bacterium]